MTVEILQKQSPDPEKGPGGDKDFSKEAISPTGEEFLEGLKVLIDLASMAKSFGGDLEESQAGEFYQVLWRVRGLSHDHYGRRHPLAEMFLQQVTKALINRGDSLQEVGSFLDTLEKMKLKGVNIFHAIDVIGNMIQQQSKTSPLVGTLEEDQQNIPSLDTVVHTFIDTIKLAAGHDQLDHLVAGINVHAESGNKVQKLEQE